MSSDSNVSSIPGTQSSDALYPSLPQHESALDQARIASMADEGGVSAAFIETCEPCIEIEERAAPWRLRGPVFWSALAGALAALVIGTFAVARRQRPRFRLARLAPARV
jgi:hypothetical protein